MTRSATSRPAAASFRDTSSPSRSERLFGLFAPQCAGEGRCVAWSFSCAFVLLVCYYVLKTLREPLLLVSAGAETKSYACAATAAALLVLCPTYSFLHRRVGKDRLMPGLTLFFAANLAAFYIAARAGVDIGFAYYVWVGVFGVAILAQFWAHMADLFSVESGQRVFPAILGGATLGGLLGPPLASALFDSESPATLILLAIGLLLVTLPLGRATRACAPRARGGSTAEEGVASPCRGMFALLLSDRYLQLLAVLAVLLNCVNSTGEYMLTELVIEHANREAAANPELAKAGLIAAFYGKLYFASNLCAVVMQFLLTARIFRLIGVRGALFALPIVVLIGYGVLLLAPVLAVLRCVKIAENGMDYSVMNTARHALYLPLSSAAKFQGKVANDAFFWRMGDVLQAGVVYAGLHWLGFGIRDFAVLNIAVGVVWLAVTTAVARRYRERAGLAARSRPRLRSEASPARLRARVLAGRLGIAAATITASFGLGLAGSAPLPDPAAPASEADAALECPCPAPRAATGSAPGGIARAAMAGLPARRL